MDIYTQARTHARTGIVVSAPRASGYVAKTNIGRSNFKIDVAIADKDNNEIYSLGILLDGSGYHNTQTTRDREIVQPIVLRGLGWKIMRVIENLKKDRVIAEEKRIHDR